MPIVDNSDNSWEYFGQIEPYFGVITSKDFCQQNLNDDVIANFFDSGKNHIDQILSIVQTHLVAGFRPKKALDFGCGVGRLVIPLASICETVVGVDISESMLKESKQNCQQRGISNAEFIKSDDLLSHVSGSFDFIHSYIVFQHIPSNRGETIFQKLIDLLSEGGVGVLHFTYCRKSTILRRLVYWARKSVPFFNSLINLLQKRHFNYPMMQMNEYDLGNLFQILQNNNCHHSYMRFSRESNTKTTTDGVIICFQKKKMPYL